MYSIIEIATNKLVIASVFNDVENGHIAIQQICTLENPDNKEIYFNFETQQFYLQND